MFQVSPLIYLNIIADFCWSEKLPFFYGFQCAQSFVLQTVYSKVFFGQPTHKKINYFKLHFACTSSFWRSFFLQKKILPFHLPLNQYSLLQAQFVHFKTNLNRKSDKSSMLKAGTHREREENKLRKWTTIIGCFAFDGDRNLQMTAKNELYRTVERKKTTKKRKFTVYGDLVT